MSRALADVLRRCALLVAARELAAARAANDNDCGACLTARRRGEYVCPAHAGKGVLW